MKVLLIAPVPPPYGGMALQAQQLETLLRRDGIQVVRLASNFALFFPFGRLERIAGIRTLLRALLIWPKVWSRARHVDVVHVLAASWLYFFMVVYPTVLVGKLLGRRIVVNYRGGEAREFFRRYGWLIAPAFKLATAVTAPSEFLAATIRERFGVPVSIVPNIVDSSLFSFRPRPALRPTLLVTRHLEKIYDIESVLKAFRTVQAQYPDASLRIAGSGGEEARLRELVANWHLTGVTFLGEVPQRDLPAVYNQCDIYVNASRVDNFPGALLEASASGLVVVSTGAGGIPAIYQDGRTAMLVEPGDWEGLAAAAIKVLQHPPLATALADAALAVVRACDWKEVRKRLFEAYGFRLEADAARESDLDGAPCAAG